MNKSPVALALRCFSLLILLFWAATTTMAQQPGSLGAWNSTASLVNPVEGPAAVAYQGRIYVLGGLASPSGQQQYLETVVFMSTVNADGTLQPWQSTTPFVNGRYLHAAVVDSTNGVLYVIGGATSIGGMSSGTADVQFAHILPGGVGIWTATTPLPIGLTGHSALVYGGYLYVLGGLDGNGNVLSSYFYAPLNPDGGVGAWRQGTFTLTQNTAYGIGGPRRYLSSFSYNGHLYVSGGLSPWGNVPLGDVQVALVPSSASRYSFLMHGETEDWKAISAFQTARYSHGMASENRFVYVVGGESTPGSPPDRSDVQYAEILNDGTLGAWTTATALPSARSTHACLTYGGRIYVIGGDVPASGGTQQTASVLYAAIQSASDTTPPKTQVSPLPGPQPSTSVNVTLTAMDIGGSGVAGVRYTLDGSDPLTSPTAKLSPVPSFNVAGTTPMTLRASAFDAAGNSEPTATFSYSTGSQAIWTPPQPAIDPFDLSPNFWTGNRGIGDIDSIVIHTTERGQAAGRNVDGYDPAKTFAENQLLAYTDAISWFKTSTSQVSAHYVVGPNGEIHQMVQDKDIAWHATYYNPRSIGIECAGFADRKETWNSQKLTTSLTNLVAWLCAKYHISVVNPPGDAISGPLQSYSGFTGLGFKSAGLVAHSQIQPGCNKQGQCMTIEYQGGSLVVKTDPGVDFPWSSFHNSVLARLNPQPSQIALQQVSAGLTDIAQTTPAVSPSGAWIGFRNSPVFHLANSSTGLIQGENSDADQTLGNGGLFTAVFSADLSLKAFASDDVNLVTGDTNGVSDVFVWNRDTGVTERVSVSTAGEQANGASYDAAISADGRYVAFTSVATNLVNGDSNGVPDIFVRDRQTGTTVRVSVDNSGGQANGPSYSPSLSADGRYVTFVSEASNLVAGDTNGVADIFVHDLQTGATTRISTGLSGADANGPSRQPSISGDGRYVAFESLANNLVPSDTNGFADVFLYDRGTSTVQRISVGPNGEQGNGHSREPRISTYGLRIAFISEASNLVANDTNGLPDVFVASFSSVPTVQVSTSASPLAGGTTTGDGSFTNGANVTVIATANPGYTFTNWTESGTVVSTLNSYQFTVTSDRTLVANFVPSSTVTSVSVSPSTASINPGGTQQFTATVNGTGNPSQSVTWSANGGSVNSSGFYTAPSTTGSYTVTATSVQDGTKSGSASVMVTTVPAPVINAFTATPAAFQSGGSVTLAWSVTGTVTSLSISGGVGDVTGQTSKSVSPTGTSDITFTLIASNAGVQTTRSVLVAYRTKDINGDGVTDVMDLARLAQAYGLTTAACDLNGDGIEDDKDLTIFLTGF